MMSTDCLKTESIIVLDTSVLVAILTAEDDAPVYSDFIDRTYEPFVVSAASYLELFRVMKFRKGPAVKRDIDTLISAFQGEIVPVCPEQIQLACDATVRFPVLNYGDCFSYALAKHRHAPLLFKGNDFLQTDVKIAHIAA